MDSAFMLPWVTLLALAPISEQFATAPKSKISLYSPWTTVFRGETLVLICTTGSRSIRSQETKWYHRERLILESRGNTLEAHESGDYRCQAGKSPESDPINLLFSENELILQAPLYVFEGDQIVLKCRSRETTESISRSLYKDGKFLRWLHYNSNFRIDHASLKDSGKYQCIGTKKHCCNVSSNAVNIQVQELFPPPVLTASPSSPRAGKSVTLTCKTQLLQPKSNVQLEFCFFKDYRPLRSYCTNYPRLWISAKELEDPGYYSCTAKTSGVSKSSNTVSIQVQTPVSRPVLSLITPRAQALEGTTVTFYCEVQRGSPPILYKFYRGSDFLWSQSVPSGGGVTLSLSLTTEHSGNYYCTAQNGFSNQRSEAVSLSVIVPASRPVLTLRTPGAQAVVGDEVELHCEVARGSPWILYRFYHEDVVLGTSWAPSGGGGASFNLSLTAEHSGSYHCEADYGVETQRSDTVTLRVTVPASRPVLTLRTPGAQAVVGDEVELHCEAARSSPRILYRFYHEDVVLGTSSAPSGGGASFNLSLTTEHSGSYHCEADYSIGALRSDTVTLRVTVPASRPVLTLRAPRAQAVVGDEVELHCEAARGSPPILYRFYHEDVVLESISDPLGKGASFNLSLMVEHSGNYSCKADNGLGAQHSDTVTLRVTVPASRPVLTLRAPGAQAVVGDEVELHCEALRGSPPILYRFYHEDVILGNSSAPSGGGASFNLSLTAEHSGNYSCEADNGLGAQRSAVAMLNISGMTENRSGLLAMGLTRGLLGSAGLAAGVLLVYCWLSRKPGGTSGMRRGGGEKSRNRSGNRCQKEFEGKVASDPSRNPSDSGPPEPTYHNVSEWVELQPVYINVNAREGDVVYSEIQKTQEEGKCAAASAPSLIKSEDPSVIYAQVKRAHTPTPSHLPPSAPHR